MNRGDEMIKQIGTKVYYCNITGNVIKIIGDMQGYVKETNFDEDYLIYQELNEREKNTIELIQVPYGQYVILSKNSTGVMVNLETKELVFTYEPIPEEPLPPTIDDIVKEQANKISILEGQVDTQTTLITNIQNDQLNQDDSIMQGMMGTAEVCEMVIMLQEQIDAMQPTSPVALNLNNKLGGDSAMVEVYANLVLAGKYTCNPNEAVNGVKLVPSVYREQVKAKLNEWAK